MKERTKHCLFCNHLSKSYTYISDGTKTKPEAQNFGWIVEKAFAFIHDIPVAYTILGQGQGIIKRGKKSAIFNYEMIIFVLIIEREKNEKKLK